MKATVLAMCVAGAAMGIGATVHAGIPAAIPVNAPNYGREADVLKEAYATLEKADHDYKGHRVAAMHHIATACDLLGQPIKGDGRGHQPQPVSDAELKDAQHKVEMVRHYIGGTQPAIASQLDEAIKQIGIALTVK
jgi:hypothetical protein